MSENIIEMTDIVKKFYIGTPNELTILKGISITVKQGEFISIVGASGSGKSTLMNIIGALDHPTEGTYILGGEDTSGMKGNKLSDIRNRKVGFVFQTFNLIPRTNALRNVELPMLYAGLSGSKRNRHAKELLELVGMGDRMRHLPNELSGGQKQRVAIARAMANNPDIILANAGKRHRNKQFITRFEYVNRGFPHGATLAAFAKLKILALQPVSLFQHFQGLCPHVFGWIAQGHNQPFNQHSSKCRYSKRVCPVCI